MCRWKIARVWRKICSTPRLRCTLGGNYAVAEYLGGGKYWQSTATPKPGQWMPENYSAPLMEWFRGADASLIQAR